MSQQMKPKKRAGFFKVLVGIAGIVAAVLAGVTIFQTYFGQQSDSSANETLAAIGKSQTTLQAQMVTALSAGNMTNQTAAAVQATYLALEAQRNTIFATLTPGYQAPTLPGTPEPIMTDAPVQTDVVENSPIPPTVVTTGHEMIVLANSEDNSYQWDGGSPYVTTKFVFEGTEAFIPTDSNKFQKELGTVGYEANEVRYITFQLFLLKSDAGLELMVETDNGDKDHRWGFDGRQSYQGIVSYLTRKGNSLNLPVNVWIPVKLDLINDLGLKPGHKVTGLGFYGNDGNMVYDRVTLISSDQ